MLAGQENKNSQVLAGEVQEWGRGWGVGPEKGSGQRPGGFTEVKDTHSLCSWEPAGLSVENCLLRE